MTGHGQDPDRGGQTSERDGRSGGTDGYGWVVVERSGGIGGMLMAWELDIDSSADRDELGRQVADLPWSQAEKDADDSAADRTDGGGAADRADGGGAADRADDSAAAHTEGGGGADRTDGGGGTGGADRFEYLIESRYGRVRFGEARMPQEWKRLVDDVRHSPEARRRRPGRE